MQALLDWDQSFFRLINTRWTNDFFDFLMPWLRNSEAWVPLYFFLILFAVINYKKTGWWWVAFAAATAIVSDFVSSDLIKQNIIRLRPCNEPAIADWVRVLVGSRPQSSSFTSSHAANHFAMAMFFYISLKDQLGKWPLLFFLWAFSICYAQVYVGVHYPLDVACGGIIGILIGYLSGRSFNKNFGLV